MDTLEIIPNADQTTALERMRVNLKEIETRGFVLIRNFLDQREIDFIAKDYQEARDADNANYSIAFAGQKVLDFLSGKINAVSHEVAKVSSTDVDLEQGLIYFSTTKGINFPWHQDHECYFMNQNHIDYLNFYMVIIKEKAEEGNLRVIPFDRLKQKSPEIYHKVVGSGANWYRPENGVTNISSDETGLSVGTLPFDITTIAEIPHLNAGDLLLLRGDIIHSTQATNSERVALSFRMTSSKIKISLKKMVNGAWPKIIMMMKHRSNYYRILSAFKQLNVTEATNGELKSKIILDSTPAPSRLRFILTILKLRLQLMFS